MIRRHIIKFYFISHYWNNVLNDDHQTAMTEIKYLIELIQAKWPAEVTFLGIILHKTDGRKISKLTK